LKNKDSDRESQGACRQDELFGGKLPVVKITLNSAQESSEVHSSYVSSEVVEPRQENEN
jgi:hypothetical protein